MTKSVALLSAVNPYPTDSGKAIVLAGFLRHLRSRLNASDIYYLHVGRPIEDATPFEGIDIIEMGAPSRLEQLRAVALDAGLRGRSLQETFTASPSIAQRVKSTLQALQPDLEIIDTVRMAQFTDFEPAGRRIVYFDDLFSVRYQRMLETIDENAAMANFDPLGQFGQFIPKPLHPLTSATTTRKLLLRTESHRVAKAESRVARDPRVERSLLLNDAESETLRRRTGATVDTLPVSIQLGSLDSSVVWDGSPSFIFMGLLSIAHNQDGLSAFLRGGMPRLLELQPNARLHVVGRDAPESLLDQGSSFGDHVVFHGFVPDLDEIMRSQCALVNPLRFGSGVKIKTLDALARSLPVVATTFGAEGISSQDRPGLRIVSDARAAAEVMGQLADADARHQASADARALFEERFAPTVVAQAYDRVFGTTSRPLP